MRESDVRKVAFDNEMFVWHLLCKCNINLTDKFNVVLESVGFMGLSHCQNKACESIFLTKVLGHCLNFSCLTAHYIPKATIPQNWRKKWQVMQLHKYVYMLETLHVLKVVPCHLVSAAHVDSMFVLRKKPRTSSLLWLIWKCYFESWRLFVNCA